jgi:hypothetical protein
LFSLLLRLRRIAATLLRSHAESGNILTRRFGTGTSVRPTQGTGKKLRLLCGRRTSLGNSGIMLIVIGLKLGFWQLLAIAVMAGNI